MPYNGTAPGAHLSDTGETRAAHGNASRLVACSGCGLVRTENYNQRFVEHGAWRPPAGDESIRGMTELFAVLRGASSEWRRCRLCGERMFQRVGDGVVQCPDWSVSCGIVQDANAGRRPPLKF